MALEPILIDIKGALWYDNDKILKTKEKNNMNECEQCKQLEERLKARLGLRITIPMLRDLGLRIELTKPVRTCECGQRHYAKGKCYTHYMKFIRQRDPMINELGQRIGRKGKVLCDAPACDYAMEQRTQWIDGKWYCGHHYQELFDKAKVPE